MGAWDIGPFDNDDAADWLFALEVSSDTATIAAALGVITDIGNEYLEAPDCSNALAAVEIVAALRGHPIANLPDNAKAWVERTANSMCRRLFRLRKQSFIASAPTPN